MDELGFHINEHGILHWDSGDCRPANATELAMWRALQARPAPSPADVGLVVQQEGASCGPGSHEPSPKGLGPSGFDPSRGELPQAGDIRWTGTGIEAFSHHVSHALAPVLRERGLWTNERDVIDRLRDMAALSRAAIEAMHSWQETAP